MPPQVAGMAETGKRAGKKREIPSIELLKKELAREESRSRFWRVFWNVVTVLLAAAAVTALVMTRLFVLVRINGSSMEPTLAADEIVFLRRTKEVETGDIVGFYYGGRILLKRVIARAGDLVEIDEEGGVYVNDEALAEPYLREKNRGKCELDFPYKVSEGMYFVLGDNRAVSVDSRIRAIGCVETDQIVGKVVWRAWPPDHMEFMR